MLETSRSSGGAALSLSPSKSGSRPRNQKSSSWSSASSAATSSSSPKNKDKSGTHNNSSAKNNRRRNDNAAERVISIVDFEFTPKSLHIPTGFKVIWTKSSGEPTDEHVIRFIGNEEKEAEMPFGVGGSYSRVFTYPGKYEYYCERHVFMRGEIIVEGSGERLSRSIPQGNPQDSPLAGKTSEADAKYREYVSKRQEAREKMAKLRAKRSEEHESTETSATEESAGNLALTSEHRGHEVVPLVRFGSFDDEEDDDNSSNGTQSGPPTLDLDEGIQVRFGHFDEDEEKEEASSGTPADDLKVHTPATLEMVEASLQESILKPEFDAASAIAFLNERWDSHMNDSHIRWV